MEWGSFEATPQYPACILTPVSIPSSFAHTVAPLIGMRPKPPKVYRPHFRFLNALLRLTLELLVDQPPIFIVFDAPADIEIFCSSYPDLCKVENFHVPGPQLPLDLTD